MRKRVALVEVGTAVLFAAMPLFFTDPLTLVVTTFYMAVLILVIVIDLENRLILDIVTIPARFWRCSSASFCPISISGRRWWGRYWVSSSSWAYTGWLKSPLAPAPLGRGM
ncbi:MAG: hypothetical protein M5U34_19965 [Chloroflexi bacterium]|nr:hypothetical protein [Chloroflexota bacterium]